MNKSVAVFVLFASSIFLSCEKDNESPDEFTYQTIQTKIFDSQCISCHSAGNTFAVQSDLVLTSDVSYQQLLNRTPSNSAAATEGLVLVGDKGLESLHESFLWEKINAANRHHFMEDHPEYGSLMPLGAQSLTNGELEFIRQWIVSEAPEEGIVADIALLEDDSRIEHSDEFVPLTPPEKGIQYVLGPFDVAPNYEREFMFFEPNEQNEVSYVNKIEISMRPGSHHFILYTFRDDTPANILPQPRTYRDIRDQNGNEIFQNMFAMAFHDFFAGTQWPRMDYDFPEGVALEWRPEKGLDLNSHYVNKSEDTIQGEVHINLHTVERENIQHVAQILNINNQNFTLPANTITTVTHVHQFTSERKVFQLFSHAHGLMAEFKVVWVGGDRDGETIYFTRDWEHPPIEKYNPPLEFKQGEGVRMEVVYNNWRDRSVTFGLTSEDEMMILFGYFYQD